MVFNEEDQKRKGRNLHSKRYLLRSAEKMMLILALCDCCSWKYIFWGEGGFQRSNLCCVLKLESD